MHILILSANTGGGHNTAARAIGEAFADRQCTYEIQDVLSFLSETASQVISRGHNCLYRYLPRVFGWGYRFEENHSPRLLYESMTPGARRLAAFVEKGRFDVIVCTHVFGAMMVTEAYRKHGLTVPQYFVPTDYTCYPGASTVDAEAVFMPAPQLMQEYIDGGVDPRLLVSAPGIPISAAFRHPLPQAEARQRLGLPEQGSVVLLCCGSMGCGHMHRIAPELERQLPEDATLVVLCGHNVRTYRLLQEQRGDRTVVVGFTNRIAEYLAAADVCISKPGGLSTTEMLAVHTPMVLMLAVPGCESRNLNFLEGNGLAVAAHSWDEAIAAAQRLLLQPEERQTMRERMAEIDFSSGAVSIVSYVLRKSEQK